VGKYEIGCAQLCGIGHSKMRADVIVDTPDDYKTWLAAQLKAKRDSE
jgi:cytochrome c oxidase subunit 2